MSANRQIEETASEGGSSQAVGQNATTTEALTKVKLMNFRLGYSFKPFRMVLNRSWKLSGNLMHFLLAVIIISTIPTSRLLK